MAREEGFIGNSKSRRESRRFHEKRGREKKVMGITREEKQKAMKRKNRRERRREKKRIEEEEKMMQLNLEEKKMKWILDQENKFNRFVSDIEGELGAKLVDDAVSVKDLMKHLKKNSKRRSERKNRVYFKDYLEVLGHGFDGEEEPVIAVMKVDAKDSYHWKKTILAAHYKGFVIYLD